MLEVILSEEDISPKAKTPDSDGPRRPRRALLFWGLAVVVVVGLIAILLSAAGKTGGGTQPERGSHAQGIPKPPPGFTLDKEVPDPFIGAKMDTAWQPIGPPLNAKGEAVSPSLPSASDIYKKVSPSVVVIETFDLQNRPIGQGSGVILSEDGWIATNHHVMEDASKAIVRMSDDTMLEVKGIGPEDSANDVSLIKVNGKALPYAVLSHKTPPSVGSKVYAIGSPEGFKNTFSEGLVSALRPINSPSVIQTTAAISHGSSGGPLLSSDGEVIGLTTYKIKDGENLNFAVAARQIDALFQPPNNKAWKALDNLSDFTPAVDAKYDGAEFWGLRDIKTIGTIVIVGDYLKKSGIDEAKLQTDIELRLQRSGLKISELSGSDAVLGMVVEASDGASGNSAYFYRISITRLVLPLAAQNRSGVAEVWSSNLRYGTIANGRLRNLQTEPLISVDEFVNAWLKAKK